MVLGFSKKKRSIVPELPPPPSPPQKQGIPGDFAPIKPKGKIEEEMHEVSVKPAPLEPLGMPQKMTAMERPEAEVSGPPKPIEVRKEVKPVSETTFQGLSKQKKNLKKIYDKTINEVVPRSEVIRKTPAKPVFVSMQDYKKMINDSNMIKERLEEAGEFINRLNTLQKQEEDLFEKWRLRLEDVEKKLNYVDSIIAKQE